MTGGSNGGAAELEALLRERWGDDWPSYDPADHASKLLDDDSLRRNAIRMARLQRTIGLAASGWEETEETRLEGAIARWLSAWEAVHGFAPLPRHWPGIEAPVT